MVSAIVLSYNRCSEVLVTIEKLKLLQSKLKFDFEIVIVDNASVDDTSTEVKSMHPDVKLVTKQTNNGIAGWNAGFEVAKNNYFLVLDDDSHMENGLPEAIDFLEKNCDTGVLALNIVGGMYQTDDADEWIDQQDCAGFIGCGAIIKKKVYKQVGGFAEWIYLYTHEYEYGLRCMKAGYKIKFFKNSNVVHRSSKLNRTNKLLRTFSTRNEMAIIYKYFTKSRYKYIFRVLINNLKLIKSEGFSTGVYVFTGSYRFLKMRRNIEYTPVSINTQQFFITKFKSAHSIFNGIIKKVKTLKKEVGKNNRASILICF